MTIVLGKRKRRDQICDSHSSKVADGEQSERAELQALFRQHFEARFEPLKEHTRLHSEDKQQDTLSLSSEEEVESNWEGLSNEDEDDHVQVVEHNAFIGAKKSDVSREELKTFMTTRPPSSTTRAVATAKPNVTVANPGDAATEAANLKKDLALQRLLKESHLLDAHSTSSPLDLVGQNRHKAVDLRLQDLGAEASLLTQQKMPFAQRKGIMAKATAREEKRRREAKENGIILEKKGSGNRIKDTRRDRGLDAPSVGKFRNGTLRLSKKDVADIEGPRRFSKATRGKSR